MELFFFGFFFFFDGFSTLLSIGNECHCQQGQGNGSHLGIVLRKESFANNAAKARNANVNQNMSMKHDKENVKRTA